MATMKGLPPGEGGTGNAARNFGEAEKIGAMQRLVTEALQSGISQRSMQDILEDARRKASAGA